MKNTLKYSAGLNPTRRLSVFCTHLINYALGALLSLAFIACGGGHPQGFAQAGIDEAGTGIDGPQILDPSGSPADPAPESKDPNDPDSLPPIPTGPNSPIPGGGGPGTGGGQGGGTGGGQGGLSQGDLAYYVTNDREVGILSLTTASGGENEEDYYRCELTPIVNIAADLSAHQGVASQPMDDLVAITTHDVDAHLTVVGPGVQSALGVHQYALDLNAKSLSPERHVEMQHVPNRTSGMLGSRGAGRRYTEVVSPAMELQVPSIMQGFGVPVGGTIDTKYMMLAGFIDGVVSALSWTEPASLPAENHFNTDHTMISRGIMYASTPGGGTVTQPNGLTIVVDEHEIFRQGHGNRAHGIDLSQIFSGGETDANVIAHGVATMHEGSDCNPTASDRTDPSCFNSGQAVVSTENGYLVVVSTTGPFSLQVDAFIDCPEAADIIDLAELHDEVPTPDEEPEPTPPPQVPNPEE